jgi:glc operon protein GlcG
LPAAPPESRSVNHKQITLELAQRAIDVILASAKTNGYSIAIAVADEHGDYIAFARMDDSYLRWGRNARRKAYTSAIMGRDTQSFYDELQQRQRTLLDYGEPKFTTLPGGIAVYDGKRCIGAVAVTGAAKGNDEDLARAGVAAMGFSAEVSGKGDVQALFGGEPK